MSSSSSSSPAPSFLGLPPRATRDLQLLLTGAVAGATTAFTAYKLHKQICVRSDSCAATSASSCPFASSIPASLSASTEPLFGGLELGGTTIKLCLALGSPTNVISQTSIPTTPLPSTCLNSALSFFIPHARALASLGIASFGPVDLNVRSPSFGSITSTPKPGWQGAEVLNVFKRGLAAAAAAAAASGGQPREELPIAFDTDVNAAALAEVKWGAHEGIAGQPITDVAYITVGTGVGAGVVSSGLPVSGLMHPEAGHIYVERQPGDTYKGNCPFHSSCIEGLACASSIAERLGIPASDLAKIEDNHPVWDTLAHYLASLCFALTCIASPQVIVVGGGVLKRNGLIDKIGKRFVKLNNGYVRTDRTINDEGVKKYIKRSRFDEEGSSTSAGAVGALELARLAYEKKKAAKN